MKNMKLIMEQFGNYEKEVLFEQKINETQETNEFKLFAEGKLNEEEFKTFLVETYGEELAEGLFDKFGRSAAIGAAMMGLGAAAAPPAAAAPMSPTTQVAASDNFERMQIVAQFTSNANDLRAATQEDRKVIRKNALDKIVNFLKSNGVEREMASNMLSEIMFKEGGVARAKEMFEKHLDQAVRPEAPEREGGEEQSRARYKLQILATASGDNGFDAGLIEKALENNEITDEQASQLAPLAGKANQARAVEKILGL